MRIVSYRKVSDLDAKLGEYLTPGACPSEARFIVPSRRDREWWSARAGLRDFGLDANRETRLWNWEDLYDDLFRFFAGEEGAHRKLRQIDPPDHRLILSRIVGDLLKERRDLVRDWPGLARPGFLDILSDDIRELINEAVSVEQLEAVVAPALSESGLPEGEGGEHGKPTDAVLPRLYRSYLEYLRDNALMDSAQIPLAAEDLLRQGAEDWAREKVFVFAGFLSFTHGQLRLVRRLEELGEVVVLKPSADLENFQDAAEQLEGAAREDGSPPAPGTVVSLCAADYGLEPEMVARELALWHAGAGFLSSVLPFPGFGRVGMTAPMPRVAAFEAALRRYRVPYSLSRGRSIARTLLGALLPSVWTAWIQGLESYDTALLLAQPCLAGSGLAGYEFSIDDAVRFGPRGVKGWVNYLARVEEKAVGREEKKNARRAAKAFAAVAKFCRVLEKGAAPEGLMAALHDFLTAPGLWLDALADLPLSGPELDESLRETAASIAEVDAKRLALRELQPDLGPAGKIVLKGREAVDFLNRWSEDTLIQPTPPTGGSLALYAGPPPILASHPVWILADATQKSWPGAIRSSPLLDVSDRERMGTVSAYLPSIHDKRMQKEALFRRLVQTGDVLTVLTRAAADEEGRPSSATPFLASFLADMKLWTLIEAPVVGLGALTPGGLFAPGGASAARPSSVYFPEIEIAADARSERRPTAVRAPGPEGAEKPRLAVSDLYDLLDCPLRYWLRRHARLRERRTELLGAAEAGQLTHKIWENVWRRRVEEGLTERAPNGTAVNEAKSLSLLVVEEWRRALALGDDYASFAYLLGDRRLERHRRNIEFYLLRLADAQQGVLDRLAEAGLRHEAFLMEGEAELSCEVEGVTFTGRCDRVEVFADAGNRRAVITDYKWGNSGDSEKKLANLAARRHLAPYLSEDREVFRGGLQLSAYALMLGSLFDEKKLDGESVRVSGVGFWGHRDGGLAGTFDAPFADCYLVPRRDAGKREGANLSLEERTDEAREALRCAAGLLKARSYEPCYVSDSCRRCDMKGVCRRGELRGETLVDFHDGDFDYEEDGDEDGGDDGAAE